MSIVLTKPIYNVSGGVVVPVTTLTDLNLRVDPYTSAAITQNSHMGNGVYKFINVPNANYKLFNGSDEVPSAGIIKVGEIDAVLITGDQTIAGIKTFQGAIVFEAGIKTDTIIEKTAGAGVTIDGILLKDSLAGSNIPGLSNNNSYTGTNTYSQYPRMFFDAGYVAPSSEIFLAPKKYVDDQIASIITSPFQESINKRRVMVGGTVVAGKIYTSIAPAIASCTSPDVTNQFIIEVVGTGSGSQYISVNGSSFVDYVHIRGSGRHIGIIITDVTSLIRIMTFEDCSIFLGANITTTRTLQSLSFVNCDIYAYRDTIFNSCQKLDNCNIFHPTGYNAILQGTTPVMNSNFNQAIEDERADPKNANLNDGWFTDYEMPVDPSIPV